MSGLSAAAGHPSTLLADIVEIVDSIYRAPEYSRLDVEHTGPFYVDLMSSQADRFVRVRLDDGEVVVHELAGWTKVEHASATFRNVSEELVAIYVAAVLADIDAR